MNVLTRTSIIVAVTGIALIAWGQAPPREPGGPKGPATRAAPGAKDTSLRVGPLSSADVPITSQEVLGPVEEPKPAPVLAEGEVVIDLLGELARDPTGRWWTVKHPRAGELRLLPCPELETIEQLHAKSPGLKFGLSGLVYRYHSDYYMLLRKMVRADTTAAKAPPAPAAATAEPDQEATSKPASDGASADDVAQRLLDQIEGRPVLPADRPVTPQDTPSVVVPTGQPILPGPGKMIINRLVRLERPPVEDGWARMIFESDNTLCEPPLRIMPNMQLEKMELQPEGPEGVLGAVFHVSGEIYRYRGVNYVLLRSAHQKRDLDLF